MHVCARCGCRLVSQHRSGQLPLSIHLSIYVSQRSEMSLFNCNHNALPVTISSMSSGSPAYGRNTSAVAMFLFPLLFIAVFVMHFQHPSDFFHFRLHYAPRDPVRVVTTLLRAQNRRPLFADPHMLGYIGLPLLPLCAYALYMLGRTRRPLLSGIALFVTVSGTIFLGGILGMWTAFYRGLGNVDPQYTAGAIATFRGMTAPHGAFLVTTTLGKLAIVGLALQALTLLGVRGMPKWAVACVVAGCATFVFFWDLDNWMLIGIALMMTGFSPAFRMLRSSAKPEAQPALSAHEPQKAHDQSR